MRSISTQALSSILINLIEAIQIIISLAARKPTLDPENVNCNHT